MTVASFSRILFPIIKMVWEWFKEEHSNDFEVLTYLPNSPDLSSIMGQGRFGSIRTNRILGRKVVCSDQYMYPHGGYSFIRLSVPVYPVLEMQASYLFSRAEVTVSMQVRG